MADFTTAYLHPELSVLYVNTQAGTVKGGLGTHKMPLVRGLEFENVGPSSRCVGDLSERGIALEHD